MAQNLWQNSDENGYTQSIYCVVLITRKILNRENTLEAILENVN